MVCKLRPKDEVCLALGADPATAAGLMEKMSSGHTALQNKKPDLALPAPGTPLQPETGESKGADKDRKDKKGKGKDKDKDDGKDEPDGDDKEKKKEKKKKKPGKVFVSR